MRDRPSDSQSRSIASLEDARPAHLVHSDKKYPSFSQKGTTYNSSSASETRSTDETQFGGQLYNSRTVTNVSRSGYVSNSVSSGARPSPLVNSQNNSAASGTSGKDSTTNQIDPDIGGGAIPPSTGGNGSTSGGGSSASLGSVVPAATGFDFVSSGSLNSSTAAGYNVQADLGTPFRGIKSTTTSGEMVYSSAAGIYFSN